MGRQKQAEAGPVLGRPVLWSRMLPSCFSMIPFANPKPYARALWPLGCVNGLKEFGLSFCAHARPNIGDCYPDPHLSETEPVHGSPYPSISLVPITTGPSMAFGDQIPNTCRVLPRPVDDGNRTKPLLHMNSDGLDLPLIEHRNRL